MINWAPFCFSLFIEHACSYEQLTFQFKFLAIESCIPPDDYTILFYPNLFLSLRNSAYKFKWIREQISKNKIPQKKKNQRSRVLLYVYSRNRRNISFVFSSQRAVGTDERRLIRRPNPIHYYYAPEGVRGFTFFSIRFEWKWVGEKTPQNTNNIQSVFAEWYFVRGRQSTDNRNVNAIQPTRLQRHATHVFINNSNFSMSLMKNNSFFYIFFFVYFCKNYSSYRWNHVYFPFLWNI